MLVNALKNRVAEELINASASVPPALLWARLIQRLEDELAFSEAVARWAVETWALALGMPVESVERPRPAPEPPAVERRAREVEPLRLPAASPASSSSPLKPFTVFRDRMRDGTAETLVGEALELVLHIAEKPVIEPGQFKVIPKRWIVERTFAWLGHFRRWAKDFEILVNTAENMIRIAMLKLTVSNCL